MRSRKQIEEGFKDVVVPAGSDHIKLELEILLDIRELLMKGTSKDSLKIPKKSDYSKARMSVFDKRVKSRSSK